MLKFQAFWIHNETDESKTRFDLLDTIQTRHTVDTMMISSGENLGWVQKMMGHALLKMITDKCFTFIPNMTHSDGTKFLGEYLKKIKKCGPKQK